MRFFSRVDSLSLHKKRSLEHIHIRQGFQHLARAGLATHQPARQGPGLIVWWGWARCWGLSTLDGDKHTPGLAAFRLHNFLTKTWPLMHQKSVILGNWILILFQRQKTEVQNPLLVGGYPPLLIIMFLGNKSSFKVYIRSTHLLLLNSSSRRTANDRRP